jgi:hypothetical protein
VTSPGLSCWTTAQSVVFQPQLSLLAASEDHLRVTACTLWHKLSTSCHSFGCSGLVAVVRICWSSLILDVSVCGMGS